MGFWGFKPFQNDYALDEYGGYNTPEHLKGLIWQGIRRGMDCSVDVHEIMGMILRTFKVYDGICSEANEKEVVKAIATKTFTYATADAIAGETTLMIMSCATIDFEERKKMLEYATNKMMGIIEANNREKVTLKEEPKTMADWFDSDNKVNDLFDNNKIWIREAINEENQAYKEIYNLARTVINNNFEDVTCPMILLPEHIKWIVDEDNKKDKERYINKIKSDYPNGITDIILSNTYSIKVDNTTNRILRDLNLLYGTRKVELGVVETNAKDWFSKHYPNGFIWAKGRLVSIDTKQPLEYEDGEQKVFKPNEVDIISKHTKIYRTKIEYETAMAKNKPNSVENNKPQDSRLKIKCTDKAYKGNKITAYEIMDVQGNKMWVYPDQLKENIRTGKVICENLRLTSDNRLINI